MSLSCSEISAKTPKFTNHEVSRIDTPNPNDVLCGRGGNINSHRGNEQFRSFVEKRKRVYLTARFKREKRLIASSIVNEIRAMNPPGRFLARIGSLKDKNGYWYDIGDEKARDKTSQALRENAPSIRAEIETEINKQRAEMRRQEKCEQKKKQPLSVPTQPPENGASAAAAPVYPLLQQGNGGGGREPAHAQAHHPSLQQEHRHTGSIPPSPLAYNNAHHNHYLQQYYDYYYHYYGYGAPPPPPPPGYPVMSNNGMNSANVPASIPTSAAPSPVPDSVPPSTASVADIAAQSQAIASVCPQTIYHHPRSSPYWAAQQSKTAPNHVSAAPVNSSTRVSSEHNVGPTVESIPKSITPKIREATAVTKSEAVDSESMVVTRGNNFMDPITQSKFSPQSNNQLEEDRRLAMALQKQENVMAFEERNRRFGSDRKSSRSNAYCSPGYRPRLLNDKTPALVYDRCGDGDNLPGTPTRKKRPAMSASHYFANINNNSSSGNISNMVSPSAIESSSNAISETDTNSNKGSNTNSHKVTPQQLGYVDSNMAVELQGQENDCVNRRSSKLHRKSPTLNACAQQNQIRQTERAAAGRIYSGVSLASNHMKTDFEMNQKPEASSSLVGINKQNYHSVDHYQNHDSSEYKDDSDIISLFGEGCDNTSSSFSRVRNTFGVNFNPIPLNEKNQIPRRELPNHDHRNHSGQITNVGQSQNDSSLFSHVATQIFGTFGGGVHTWTRTETENDHMKQGVTPIPHYDSISVNPDQDVETEIGQEVTMDVRDESSMPPPHPRGPGVEIDWASRAGCHSWIPDTIGANANAIFGETNDENQNHAQGAHPQHVVNQDTNDHSFGRQSSIFGRPDISPMNSMDLDFSHSSYADGQRRRSLMNIFDQKHEDVKLSILQQNPSWDRSCRSKSSISLGDMSATGNEMDDSLIRVYTRDPAKEKMVTSGLPMSHEHVESTDHDTHLTHHLYQLHSRQSRPHHIDHHQHQQQQQQHQGHSRQMNQQHQQNLHESRDMDWDGHAGE